MNQNQVEQLSEFYIRNAQKYSSYAIEASIIANKLIDECDKGNTSVIGSWAIIFTNVLLAWMSEEDENA